MIKTKNEKILEKDKTVSFDVKSLFTSVPLERTTDILQSKFTKNIKQQ